MGKKLTSGLICALIIGFGYVDLFGGGQQTLISIEKIKSMVIDKNSKGYNFLSITDIKTDEYGFVYVLDSERQIVQKYTKDLGFVGSIGNPAFISNSETDLENNIRAVAGHQLKVNKENLYSPQKIWIKNGRLYILDLGKIGIYSIEGEFIKNLHTDLSSTRAIFVNDADEIIVGSESETTGQIFCVFDNEGVLTRRFGECFGLSGKATGLAERTGINERSLGFPISVQYVNKTQRLYCMNPYKFEIVVYQNEKLTDLMRPDGDVFRFPPPQAISQPLEEGKTPWALTLISPPQMFWLADRLLVFMPDIEFNTLTNAGMTINSYKENKLDASLKLRSGMYPLCIFEKPDKSGGDMYCIEIAEGNQTVSKYEIRIVEQQR